MTRTRLAEGRRWVRLRLARTARVGLDGNHATLHWAAEKRGSDGACRRFEGAEVRCPKSSRIRQFGSQVASSTPWGRIEIVL